MLRWPLIVAMLAGLLLAPAHAAASWQAMTAQSSFAGTTAAIDVSPSGGVAIVYQKDNVGSSTEYWLNQTTAAGWGTACKITSATYPARTNLADVSVSINAGGDVIVAWSTDTTPYGVAAVYRQGGTCSAPVWARDPATAPSANTTGVSTAIDATGRAYVGWSNDGNSQVPMIRIRETSGTLSSAHGLPGSALDMNLRLGIAANARLVAASATSSAVTVTTYLPSTSTWSTPTSVYTTASTIMRMRLATHPASTSARIGVWRDGARSDVDTVAITDLASIGPAPTPTTLSGAYESVGGDAELADMAMNASGSAALLWESWRGGLSAQPDHIVASVCAPTNSGTPCSTSDLEAYTNPSQGNFSAGGILGASISLAADGSASALWQHYNGTGSTYSDIPLRVAQRSAAGSWSAAADLPGTGTATTSFDTWNDYPQLVGDAAGGVMILGRRASDGYVVTKANTAPPSTMDAPTAVTGIRQATVSWSALTANTGFAPVTSYTATAVEDPTKTCTNAGTSCTITGLADGSWYTFTVKATNTAGSGTASAASTSVSTPAPPGQPTGVGGTRGNQQVVLAWTAPGSNGGSSITSYTAQAYVGGVAVAGRTCTSSSGSPITAGCTITGLTNGVAYTFTVTATNAVGTGAESTPSSAVTPATTPGQPTGVGGTRGDGEALVSWTAPADGGSAITSYTASASPQVGGVTRTCTPSPATETSCTITGLTNGVAYTFTVVATNAVGAGSASSASASVTPASVATRPTAVTATRGDGTITVAWHASTIGTGTISGYTVTGTPGGTCTTAALTCTISGLTNGTAYSFTVVANASNGGDVLNSLPSTPAAATPAGLPGAPGGLTATASSGQVVLAWSAAAANGSAIIDYTVTGTAGATCTTAALTCTITGLANGTTYTFTVAARNDVGAGSASTGATAQPSSPTSDAPAAAAAALAAPAPAATPAASSTVGSRPGTPIAQSRILSAAGISKPAGAAVSYRISGAKGGLQVRNGALVGKRPGTYRVSVTVRPKRGKAVVKTVTVVIS